MAAMYGNRFLDMWRDIDLVDVKRCWGDELANYSILQITLAVNGLNKRPFSPTLPEFLELCEKAAAPTPAAHQQYLPKRRGIDNNDPATASARNACFNLIKAKSAPATPAWAYVAKQRWINNEIKYSPDVLKMINNAIANDNGRNDPSKAKK